MSFSADTDVSDQENYRQAEVLLKKAVFLASENNLENLLTTVHEIEMITSRIVQKLYRGRMLFRVCMLLAEKDQWEEAWRIANTIEHHSLGPKIRKYLSEKKILTQSIINDRVMWSR